MGLYNFPMFRPPTKLCPKIWGSETLSHAYGAYIESLIWTALTTSRLLHSHFHTLHVTNLYTLKSKRFSWGWMMMICTLDFIGNTAAPKIRITWQIIMVCFKWPNVRNWNTTIFINIFHNLLRWEVVIITSCSCGLIDSIIFIMH